MSNHGNTMKPIEWVETDNGCWNCNSHRDTFGYPIITRNGKRMKAHRFIYEECFGLVPIGLVVRHRCDNRRCINPEHLELGTARDNLYDRKRNGTFPSGERNGQHKLTWDKVHFIRSNYKRGSGPIFAKHFEVDTSLINSVVRGDSWRET